MSDELGGDLIIGQHMTNFLRSGPSPYSWNPETKSESCGSEMNLRRWKDSLELSLAIRVA